MTVKGKEAQANKVEPNECKDPSNEFLQALANFNIQQQSTVDRPQKGGQAAEFAAKMMNKFPSKRAMKLNV